MKKIFLFSLVASLFLFGCGPDEGGSGTTPEPVDKLAITTVKKENKSLAIKFSGTRCGPCGSWGWSTSNNISNGISASGSFMKCFGDNFVAQLFITPEGTELQNSYNIRSFPTFMANGVIATAPNNLISELEQSVYDEVNRFQAAEVKANTALKYTIEDGKLTAKYKSTAWAEVDAPYLAIYVLEDNLVGSQSGHPDGANTVHKSVMRAELTAGAAYGSAIQGLAVGTDVDGELSVDLDMIQDTDNAKIYVVMYNKGNNGYEFVNFSEGEKVD